MFKHDDQELVSIISLFMEKMRDFGFEQEESIILLMNAGEKTNTSKILKVVDYIEPPGSGVVREDIDKEIARKKIEKILAE